VEAEARVAVAEDVSLEGEELEQVRRWVQAVQGVDCVIPEGIREDILKEFVARSPAQKTEFGLWLKCAVGLAVLTGRKEVELGDVRKAAESLA
jgi:hypothetical protein